MGSWSWSQSGRCWRAFLYALALSAAACGGGGGGGSDGGAASNNWLTFAPANVTATAFEGEPDALSITATSTKTVSGVFNVGVIDTTGVLDPQGTTVRSITPYEYTASLRLQTGLPAGTHSGSFEVRLCRDDPRVCAQPIEGSPWRVPFNITVRSSTNLSPLQPLAGAARWHTYQGSARHNGYIPANVDATRFNRRFRYAVAGAQQGTEVAVENGLAVMASGLEGGAWTLHGISEANGRAAWTAPMGALFRVNAPAVADGKVYAASTGHQDSYFWTFDAASGTQLNRLRTSSQWDHYLAPTVLDGAVYTLNGSYGGLSRFNASTGAQDWFAGNLPQIDGWTPAVEGSLAYMVSSDRLWAINVVDGSTAFTVTDPQFTSYGIYSTPVLTDNGVVFATQREYFAGRLVRFDSRARTVSWWVGTAVKSSPVVVGDTVYVLDGRELHARSAQTGALLWAWSSAVDFGARVPLNPDSLKPAPLVVVGNYAIFSTREGTVALDLTTRQVAWRDPATGQLSVSDNGVLYISGITTVPAGTEGVLVVGTVLTAINLR